MSEMLVFSQMLIVLREIKASLNTFKDAILGVLGIAKVTEKPMEEGSSGSGGLFGGITKQFKKFGLALKGILKSAIGPLALLSTFMTGFLEPLELIMDPLQMIGEIFGVLLYPFLEPIANVMYMIMPYLYQFVEYLTPFMTWLAAVATPMGIINDKGATLIPILVGIGEAFVIVIDWFRNIGTVVLVNLKEGFVTFFIFWITLPSKVLQKVKEGFELFWEYFKNFGQMILDKIKDGFDVVWDWFKNLGPNALEYLGNGITGGGSSGGSDDDGIDWTFWD